MSRANLSILGLYSANSNIFNDMTLPVGINAENVRDNILIDCAELEIVYTDPDFMQAAIKIWSTAMLPTWTRIYSASLLDYDPIENYNRYEDFTEVNSGKRSFRTAQTAQAAAQTESSNIYAENSNNNDINKVAGFNVEDLQTASGSNGHTNTIGNDKTNANNVTNSSGNRDDDEQRNDVKNHRAHLHGNIGVTTSQQMIESEIELSPKLNLVNRIVRDFKTKFCIEIY